MYLLLLLLLLFLLLSSAIAGERAEITKGLPSSACSGWQGDG